MEKCNSTHHRYTIVGGDDKERGVMVCSDCGESATAFTDKDIAEAEQSIRADERGKVFTERELWKLKALLQFGDGDKSEENRKILEKLSKLGVGEK